MKSSPDQTRGIYVEIFVPCHLDRIWQLTQRPDLHQRWDLRFSRIQYLPRPTPAEPQRFLYQTRLGFGLSIAGTGESVSQRNPNANDTTSSLRFASDDPKSLIRTGSGYWRYISTAAGCRFITWYDYEVRFGAMGRVIDRFLFRRLIGWATAWSFDRLRLWADEELSPESSMSLFIIHAIARLSVAGIWMWHGLVPKLLYRNVDERIMLAQSGMPLRLLPWIGVAEVLFGLLILGAWKSRPLLIASAAAMFAATVAVAFNSPIYITAAFNPVTLNLAVAALSVTAWIASRNLPSASRCLRVDPRGQL